MYVYMIDSIILGITRDNIFYYNYPEIRQLYFCSKILVQNRVYWIKLCTKDRYANQYASRSVIYIQKSSGMEHDGIFE